MELTYKDGSPVTPISDKWTQVTSGLTHDRDLFWSPTSDQFLATAGGQKVSGYLMVIRHEKFK